MNSKKTKTVQQGSQAALENEVPWTKAAHPAINAPIIQFCIRMGII